MSHHTITTGVQGGQFAWGPIPYVVWSDALTRALRTAPFSWMNICDVSFVGATNPNILFTHSNNPYNAETHRIGLGKAIIYLSTAASTVRMLNTMGSAAWPDWAFRVIYHEMYHAMMNRPDIAGVRIEYPLADNMIKQVQAVWGQGSYVPTAPKVIGITPSTSLLTPNNVGPSALQLRIHYDSDMSLSTPPEVAWNVAVNFLKVAQRWWIDYRTAFVNYDMTAPPWFDNAVLSVDVLGAVGAGWTPQVIYGGPSGVGCSKTAPVKVAEAEVGEVIPMTP